jgi:hypothetical protein
MLRWILTFVTGLICGIIALFITFFTKTISTWKFETFNGLIEKEQQGGPSGMAFAYLVTCNIIFGCIAWTAVYLEPLAAGSGYYIALVAVCAFVNCSMIFDCYFLQESQK